MPRRGAAGGSRPSPFAFATNGRPFLRQLRTASGIWFRDLRRAANRAVALEGWYAPEGLRQLARLEIDGAKEQLSRETFAFGFPLRPYQRRAIEAVEEVIRAGQREILLAKATGTGKTKTCVALIYRLLKSGRFRRVLFLVDREELGIQAGGCLQGNADGKLANLAAIYGIKELGERVVDPDTRVHITTVQAMARRLLLGDEEGRPTVDTYDLIVVDECHRGYLLDREMGDGELRFRDFKDYVSTYRRVLDMFDAVKIALTATPALHTVEIFGRPVFVYSYREAVVDGYLVDHEPPIRIHTQLSSEGIRWQAGEQVTTIDPRTGQIDLFTTPDELRFDVAAFNQLVLTEAFNRVVCEALADELDPFSPHKTLIFCVGDGHADLVVQLLKEAFAKRYGEVPEEAVAKITGRSDKPAQLIRRFKNEAFPNVAVTVDLLSTGVDVPAIGNIVFLRRVNSRILYDQMRGRATRLCEAIGKTHFRIFDAVGVYDALQPYTDMKPVVVDPKIPFSQLLREFATTEGEDAQLVRDQLIAKLRRKRSQLSESGAARFRLLTGEDPEGFVTRLRGLPAAEAQRWLGRSRGWGKCSTPSGRARAGRCISLSTRTNCGESSGAMARPSGRRITGGIHGVCAGVGKCLASAHRGVAAALGAHPQGSAGAALGPGCAGLQRGQPGHRLARNHQPGDGRFDHGVHPPGGAGRSAGALRAAGGRGAGANPGVPKLDKAATGLVGAHRQPNQGAHDRGSGSTG